MEIEVQGDKGESTRVTKEKVSKERVHRRKEAIVTGVIPILGVATDVAHWVLSARFGF